MTRRHTTLTDEQRIAAYSALADKVGAVLNADQKEQQRAVGEFLEAICQHQGFELTAAAIVPVLMRLAEAERRLTAVEARPNIRFTGVHEDGVKYKSGDVVVSGGSAWICVLPTSTVRPGAEEAGQPRHWRLLAQRGKDGRPGKDGKDAA